MRRRPTAPTDSQHGTQVFPFGCRQGAAVFARGPLSGLLSSLVNYLQADCEASDVRKGENCYICSLLVFNPTVSLYKHVNSSKENKTIFNSSECQHFILVLQANPPDRLRNKTENSNATEGSFPMKLIFKFILERWYKGVLDFIKQYQ